MTQVLLKEISNIERPWRTTVLRDELLAGLKKFNKSDRDIQIFFTRQKSHTATMSSSEASFFQGTHPRETIS